MTCNKCMSLYTAYKDGELSAKRRSEVKEHIRMCEACRSTYSTIDQILGTSASLPSFEAAEDFVGRLLSKIRSSEQVLPAPASRLRWLVPRLAYGALVMVLAAVISFGVFYVSGRKGTAPVVELIPKERVYSLGPEPRTSEIVVDEPDYSLGHEAGPEDVIYLLPSHSTNARLASY